MCIVLRTISLLHVYDSLGNAQRNNLGYTTYSISYDRSNLRCIIGRTYSTAAVKIFPTRINRHSDHLELSS